jgi:hypothetical protein
MLIGGFLGGSFLLVAFSFVSPSRNPLLFSVLFALAFAYVGMMGVYRQDDLLFPQDPVWVRSFVKGSLVYGCVSGIVFYLALLYFS